jgi:hypothetical protein
MRLKIARWATAVCASAAVLACDDDPASPELPARYQVEVSGETFIVQVDDHDQAQQMEARLASGAEGVVSGELAAGDGGFNAPWSWHMIPSSVHAPDLTIEICDGRPSMVQEDLAYWLDTVERFCPWGATVVARLD